MKLIICKIIFTTSVKIFQFFFPYLFHLFNEISFYIFIVFKEEFKKINVGKDGNIIDKETRNSKKQFNKNIAVKESLSKVKLLSKKACKQTEKYYNQELLSSLLEKNCEDKDNCADDDEIVVDTIQDDNKTSEINEISKSCNISVSDNSISTTCELCSSLPAS